MLHADDLRQFHGTDEWYRHPLNRQMLYTDGARYVATEGEAYWLLDVIALAARQLPALVNEAFQVWTLQVSPDRSAEIYCENGNGLVLWQYTVPWTDFPLDTITLWCVDNVIMLPSEY